MMTRSFVFPTDDHDNKMVVLATINEVAYERLKNWRKTFQQIATNEPLSAMTYESMPEALFELITLQEDATLDHDTAELFECVFAEGSTYQLGKSLDPMIYKVVESDLTQLEVSKAGLSLLFTTDHGYPSVDLVTWNELGIDNEDPRRCRYNDCAEAHPVAGESELVTCHTCRREMALPVEGEEN